MCIYKLLYFSCESFKQLKGHWKQLEIGDDMTYFQSYDWYQMLVSLNKRKILFGEVVFVEILLKNSPILIAPLFITKNNFYKNYPKGAYFFGNQGWNDYCNFIYKEFDKESFLFLCSQIKQKYDIEYLFLDFIKEDTQLYSHIHDRDILDDRKGECVRLNLPLTKEDYLAKLSKNAKQNIRTSYNRLAKDGIKMVVCPDDKKIDLESFKHHRTFRVMKKNGITRESGRIRKRLGKIKRAFFNYRTFFFPEYTPFENDDNSRFLTIKNVESGELCAAFNYGFDDVHKEIVLMAVSLNSKYSRYSPGMIALYEYICSQIGMRDVCCVDFTRGNEKYKFSLGGESHFNHCVTIKI